MANVSAAVMAAVRRKLNVTWDDETTDARLQDVVETVSPRLASLLGYPSDYVFLPTNRAFGSLFLNACLYEFSDAWDDFEKNYADVIHSERLLAVATFDPIEYETNKIMDEIYDSVGGDDDAQAQG